jgi:hypothetical protein
MEPEGIAGGQAGASKATEVAVGGESFRVSRDKSLLRWGLFWACLGSWCKS